jgi:Transposase IS116/IS110/IS902 family.
MKKNIMEHIKWLTDTQKQTDNLLFEKIKENSQWNEIRILLSSVPGVGPVMTFTLIAELSEIGTLNRKEISALVGVAPLNHDSGRHHGDRAIWGGRAGVREILYMCTISAIRCNPVIKKFNERLRNSGKEPKVAIVACMHKLLMIINSMIRKGELWSYSYNTK